MTQPPAGPPPGYGYPPPGAWPPPRHPEATTVLVLGILSIVACSVVGPFAWVKGNRALAAVDAHPAAWSGRSEIQAGRIMGIVGTVFLGITVAVLLLYVVLIGTFVASGSLV